MQVLCEECNLEKSNKNCKDYRPESFIRLITRLTKKRKKEGKGNAKIYNAETRLKELDDRFRELCEAENS